MNVIFDLDGTLIDSRPRLYHLFQHLVPESQLSFAAYWKLKRNKVSHQQILADEFGFDAAAVEGFVGAWMRLIETPEFLALDTATPGIRETLAALQGRARLHLCTARQSRTVALEQLGQLDLAPYFCEVLVTGQALSKERLIRDRLDGLGAADWMVGDTGHDIQAGRALGMKTCAVLSGFQNRATLSAYLPDRIIESASDFQPE